MSKDNIKSFSSRHIFNLLQFNGKLPKIPILVNEYKSKIKNEILSLDYRKEILNTERENNKIRNSIFNNINRHQIYKKKNNNTVFKRKYVNSATPKKIYSRNTKYFFDYSYLYFCFASFYFRFLLRIFEHFPYDYFSLRVLIF